MSILSEWITKEAKAKNKDEKAFIEEIIKNAEKISIATHIGKYTNPDAKVVAYVEQKRDNEPVNAIGYISTSNTHCTRDVMMPTKEAREDKEEKKGKKAIKETTFCNVCYEDIAASSAKYLSSANFMTLQLEDGRSVFEHFATDSALLKKELKTYDINFNEAKAYVKKFLPVQIPNETDNKISQVYFPIGNGKYAILSVLPPSGISLEAKKRIKKIRENRLDARNKKSPNYGKTHKRLHDLTTISIGGANPWNISFLNSKNAGKLYMLPAFPPVIKNEVVRMPRTDFFKTLWAQRYTNEIEALHEGLIDKRRNKDGKARVQKALERIIDKIVIKASQLQEQEKGWTNECELPEEQAIWLDKLYEKDRHQNNIWQEVVAGDGARWIIDAYKKVKGKAAVTLGDAETHMIQDEFEKAL